MGCQLMSTIKNCPSVRSTCVGCAFELKEMVEGGMPTWYKTKPKTSILPTVDARSYQHPVTVCLHGGREHNNEKTHRCSKYVQSIARPTECMYWCKDNARCDCWL